MSAIRLFDCSRGQEALDCLGPVFRSGQLAWGDAVSELESSIAERVGGNEVVAIGNMTHALQLALELAGVSRGDSVATMSFNCMSSSAAIPAAGGEPIWTDLDPQTARIKVTCVEQAIGPRTKAVVAYHMAGYPADVHALRALCDRRGLALIEDANNAFGATIDGVPVGSFGDFAVFSFYANRQVNAIEGAALVCRDPAAAVAARKLRRFGIDMGTFRTSDGEIDPNHDIRVLGIASPLSNVNACLGLQSLRSVDLRLSISRRNADFLINAIAGLPDIAPVTWDESTTPAFWVLLLRSTRRDAIQKSLREAGVQTSRLHHPNHLYSCFGTHSTDLPGTARFAQEAFAVPCGWWLTNQELGSIASILKKSVRSM